MTADRPVQRILEEVEGAADEETLAAVDEELEARYGLDSDGLAELDELLAEYRDELQAVHDEFQQRLADAGFDDLDLGGSGPADAGEGGTPLGGRDDAARDG